MQELYCSLLRGFFKYLAVSFFPSFLSWQFKSEEIHLSVVERKRTSTKMLKRNLQGFYSQLLSSLTFFQPVHLHPSLYRYITKNEAIFLKLSSLSSKKKKKMKLRTAPSNILMWYDGIIFWGSAWLIWILVLPQILCLSPASDPVCLPSLGLQKGLCVLWMINDSFSDTLIIQSTSAYHGEYVFIHTKGHTGPDDVTGNPV